MTAKSQHAVYAGAADERVVGGREPGHVDPRGGGAGMFLIITPPKS